MKRFAAGGAGVGKTADKAPSANTSGGNGGIGLVKGFGLSKPAFGMGGFGKFGSPSIFSTRPQTQLPPEPVAPPVDTSEEEPQQSVETRMSVASAPSSSSFSSSSSQAKLGGLSFASGGKGQSTAAPPFVARTAETRPAQPTAKKVPSAPALNFRRLNSGPKPASSAVGAPAPAPFSRPSTIPQTTKSSSSTSISRAPSSSLPESLTTPLPRPLSKSRPTLSLGRAAVSNPSAGHRPSLAAGGAVKLAASAAVAVPPTADDDDVRTAVQDDVPASTPTVAHTDTEFQDDAELAIEGVEETKMEVEQQPEQSYMDVDKLPDEAPAPMQDASSAGPEDISKLDASYAGRSVKERRKVEELQQQLDQDAETITDYMLTQSRVHRRLLELPSYVELNCRIDALKSMIDDLKARFD